MKVETQLTDIGIVCFIDVVKEFASLGTLVTTAVPSKYHKYV